jgi:hypothetical protein
MTDPVESRGRPAAGDPRGRRILLLLAAITVAPVLASYTIYYFFPRSTQVNYGTLLPTAPAPEIRGERADGTPWRLAELRGRWVLLVAGDGRCDAACQRKLYATRQARTMQGREQDRIVRVWLVSGASAPDPSVLTEQPGLVTVGVADAALAALPAGPGAIYLIDPLGNLVLQYSDDPDIKGISKDLGRVLKASGIG